jgi:glycosyl transferase family 25
MEMQKFVINLKRRNDRLDKFTKICPYNNVQTVYGFDAKNPLDESVEEQAIYYILRSLRLTNGECGVWISHLRIWENIVKNQIENAMIFEDDALFNNRFLEVMNNINIDTMPKNSIIFIGGRFNDNFIMPDQFIIPYNKYICQSNLSKFNGVLHDRTLHAYIISFHVAKQLIEVFHNKLKDPDCKVIDPVDHFVIRGLRALNYPIYSIAIFYTYFLIFFIKKFFEFFLPTSSQQLIFPPNIPVRVPI